MGKVVGLPEWVVLSSLILCVFLAMALRGWRNTKRQVSRTVAKRANPVREDFLEMMAPDVSREASEFVWEHASDCLAFYCPDIAPHPDDHLIHDLPIDEDDWSLDWPFLWARQCDFPEKNLPDWPSGWPVTIRNFARWLDLGPQA
ncbi:MAG: hypothetical protein AAF559_02590 [Pseudomonadota bacterium]